MTNLLQTSLLLLSLFIINTNSLSCDKIAFLPPDFSLLLPDTSDLATVHLTNNYFLSSPLKESNLKFHIKIPFKSVIKFQVTPHHTSLEVSIETPKQNITFHTSCDTPLDYTLIEEDQLFEGDIYFNFNLKAPNQDTLNEEIKSLTSKDTECSQPYMLFEIYYQDYDMYKARIESMTESVNDLIDFSEDFWGVFNDLKKMDVKEKGKEMLIQKIKRDISPYKLKLKDPKAFYMKYNIHVIDEFDLIIPKDTSTLKSEEQDKSLNIVNKMFIKMQMYSEFLLGGGIHMLIIKSNSIEELENLNCVGNGKCILSQRRSKNGMILETILTAGEYKLLIINTNMWISSFKQSLKLNSIPISAGIKLKNIVSNENRFNCKGRKLPITFNHLLNLNRNYFEYKGNIIFNMRDLYDEVYLTTPEIDDYVIRINAYFHYGNSIKIKLYEVNSQQLKDTMNTNPDKNIIDEIESDSMRNISSESAYWGGQSSLYAPLDKGKVYVIRFDYSDSFFSQYERKSCELYYLKLAISSASNIKTFYPKAYNDEINCIFKSELIDSFLDNFSKDHANIRNYINDEYKIISPEINAYNNMIMLRDIRIFYKGKFKIDRDISFYIEIMGDFVTSSVIPIILSSKDLFTNADINDIEFFILQDYRRLTLHKGTINMKLSKGEYYLILIHGLNQFTISTFDTNAPLMREILLPSCTSFKIKINTMLLNTTKLQSWECNFLKFHHIPEGVELDNKKDKFYYFNHHILIPTTRNIINIKTKAQKFILRLKAQFSSNEDIESISISLKKNNKNLRRAKRENFEEGESSQILYLNYLLLPNSTYELHFSNEYKNFAIFYDICRMFTLDLLISNADSNRLPPSQCVLSIPNAKDVIYERVIDVENSFYEFKSSSIYQMMFDKSPSKQDTSKNDLESNPSLSLFKYLFNANNTMEYNFTFDINSKLARGTLLIETPFAFPIDVSARLYSIKTDGKEEVTELIATEDIEDENILSMRGLLLNEGKYKVKFGVNTKMYSLKVLEALKNFCVEYTASLIIENKPYDFMMRSAVEKMENCPYIEFPSNLNIPGWVYSDTLYSINLAQRFKIKNPKMTKTFSLYSQSYFKFYLPDYDHINLKQRIKLLKDKGNKQTVYVSKINNDDSDNAIAILLEPGDYSLEFYFDLNERRSFFIFPDSDQYEHLCYYFDVYIAIIPLNFLVEPLSTEGTECKEDLSAMDIFIPENNEIYRTIQFKNEFSPLGKAQVIKTIKIKPNSLSRSKLQLELIYNTYKDPLYLFTLYKIEKDNTRTKVSTDSMYSGNFVWFVANIDKSTEYEIDFSNYAYIDVTLCAQAIISYGYSSKVLLDDMGNKGSCAISARLPKSLYNNKEGTLTPYGKGQSISNGEMYFYGDFLLPKSSQSIKTEFIIKEESVVIVQVIPLYKKNSNNIDLEIYSGKNIFSTSGKTSFKGFIITSLTNIPFIQNLTSVVYSLTITFDRRLSKCESFTLIFSIIPKKAYLDVYTSCKNIVEDTGDNIIPSNITIDKTTVFQYASHIGIGFNKNEKNNYEKIITLDIKKPIALDIRVKYVHSDNLMDVSLYREDNKIVKLGSQTIEGGHVNGVWIHKTISINIKKGIYKIKLLYHAIFKYYLKKIYDKEINSICFGFNFEISATELNLLSGNSVSGDDESNEDSEIKKITSTDIPKASITKVSPVGAQNLRIGNSLDIKISFAYSFIKGTKELNTANELIYLIDSNDFLSNQIFPSYIKEFTSEKVIFTFELNDRDFEIKKCYILRFNKAFSNQIDDLIIDKVDHLYCTMKCDCNSKSNFSCSLTGKCRCKSPYTGQKCERCIEGYVLSNNHQCIEEKLTNLKCSDQITCNGNGYCIIPESSFDPYDKNIESPCICNSGFDTLPGYPVSSFCNTCRNANKFYPFCYSKEGGGFFDYEQLKFTFSTHCSEFDKAPTLPKQMYSKMSNRLKSDELNFDIQKIDGSLSYTAILKVANEEEETRLLISEDSIIRVMFISKEYNRAKVALYGGKGYITEIAGTEGREAYESFIARVKRRNEPYIIKIRHLRLKAACNRYQIKIFVETMKNVDSHLECDVNRNNRDKMIELLPIDEIDINGNDDLDKFKDVWYKVADELILKRENFKDNKNNNNNNNKDKEIDYTNKGILSNGTIDETFKYNIRLNVKNSVTFSCVVKYIFISNEVSLILRNSKGEKIVSSNWMTSELSDENKYFYGGLVYILDPGEYYLTITENLSVNHLTQLYYIEETDQHPIKHCYDFMLNIQPNLIAKPDKDISSEKYESLFNRIVSIEPSYQTNLKTTEKLNLYVTFNSNINSKPKQPDEWDIPSSFSSAFYLESELNERIYAENAFIQGSYGKTFQVIFNENILLDNTCYILKFDLSMMETYGSDKRKIITDEPIIHKYCTKTCDCNPYIDVQCRNSECVCKSPYKGKKCDECINGYYSLGNKCISQENCDSNLCNDKGKCQILSNGELQCLCAAYFTGYDCSKCENATLIFPDCASPYIKQTNKRTSIKGESLYTERTSRTVNDCEFQFIPYDLNTLGYLHLDGNMHISGKYSLKSIGGKNYQMTFNLKENSHIKIHVEYSKMSFLITMFLLNIEKELLHTSTSLAGPAGAGSAAVLDFIIGEGKYYIMFYVKDIEAIDSGMSVSFEEAMSYSNSIDEGEGNECVNVFMEMQVMTIEREVNVLNGMKNSSLCANYQKDYNTIQMFPKELSVYDYQLQFYKDLALGKNGSFAYMRKGNYDNEIDYFHYEYIYIPDLIDKQLSIELEIDSKFLNAEIGVLLEIVEIPPQKVNMLKRKTHEFINELINETITQPKCEVYCFSGIKKYNSIILSRTLPSDTFMRIWFYDVSPYPYILNSINYPGIKCIPYQTTLKLFRIDTVKDISESPITESLCQSSELPSNLNTKDYLGTSEYIKKFGFHLLDDFRIDRIKKFTHIIHFEIDSMFLFRLVVSSGRVDINLELRHLKDSNEEIIVTRSQSRNSEGTIAVEIGPGKYNLIFKFFPPSSGFHKCESMKVELAMRDFEHLYDNVIFMNARYIVNGRGVLNDYPKIKIFELLQSPRELFSKDLNTTRYPFSVEPSFIIGEDKLSDYKSSIILDQIIFTIESKDNNKIKLHSYAISNFILFDVGLYLIYKPEGSKESIIISSTHKKNMNILFSKKLKSGTYTLSLRYCRRLNYKTTNKDNTLNQLPVELGEVEFDAQFVNLADDIVTVLTSNGYIKVHPLYSKPTSQYYSCRKFGVPVPKTLSSLRYLLLDSQTHILDNYILPHSGSGSDEINFKLSTSYKSMIRIYTESSEFEIYIEIRKYISNRKKYSIIAKSSSGGYFNTLMEILEPQKDYSIYLKYTAIHSMIDMNTKCKTFKMEIAVERSHSYECVENNKYSLLTSLTPIPKTLPLKKGDNNNSFVFSYNSRDFFNGEYNNSGYVYLLRSPNDTYIEFATFDVVKAIDFKFEVSNDFIQAPVTIMLASAKKEVNFQGVEISKLVSNIFNRMKVKSFIIAYGELLESRTSLLVKNLPIGKYTVYIYLPGLKTSFKDHRICSLYDLNIEIKKSRFHYKTKEIISTSETRDELLDMPIKVPYSLNTPRFMSGYGPYTYINYINNYYLRENITESVSNNENGSGMIVLYNTIEFTLFSQSLVEFDVNQNDNDINKIDIAINGYSNYATKVALVLNKGNYFTIIRYYSNSLKPNDKNDKAKFNSIAFNQLIKLYIGISPTERVDYIYKYNNLLSSFRQCISSSITFPKDQKSGEYRFNDAMFMIRSENIDKNGIISSMTLDLTKSSRNRLIAELGTDYVLNKLSINILSGTKKFYMKFQNNHGFLDLILPNGEYKLNLVLDSPILLSDYTCLIMSINIHIIELDRIQSNILSRFMMGENENERILAAPKCNGGIIPLEILPNSNIPNQNISPDGSYSLHINDALYFVQRQKSKMNKNLNEIDIKVNYDSLLHITTMISSSHLFKIIPKVTFVNDKDNKTYYKIPKGEIVSANLRERNTFFHLQKNKNSIDDYYTLQLGLGSYITSKFPQCPYYALDIIITEFSSIVKKYTCKKKNGKYYTVPKPKNNISINSLEPYHEQLEYSHFTEKEYAKMIIESDFYNALSYKIDFEISSSEYYITADIGYDHSISVFDLYLLKENELISSSSTIIDKNKPFAYHRTLQSTITKGKFQLVIMEYTWHNITNLIKAKAPSNNANDIYLCLPFSYSIDITTSNEMFSFPRVISIFPPGPNIYTSKRQDVTIKVILNKEPYTRKLEPITTIYNYMSLMGAFSIVKTNEKGLENAKKISPTKVQGNVNNKEWELLFSSSYFDEGMSYELIMNSNWIYDNKRDEFSTWIKGPIIKVESSSNNLFGDPNEERVNNLMMSALENKDDIIEETIEEKIEISKSDIENKCGAHGKYIYDRILKKNICMCFDGFSGALCDYCEGNIIGEKCVESEDESQTRNDHKLKESKSTIIKNDNNNKDTQSKKEEKMINDCGGCLNGYCDIEKGKCVCFIGYRGNHCQNKIEEEKIEKIIIVNNNNIIDKVGRLWKFASVFAKICIIVIAVIAIISLLKWYLKKGKLSEYDIIKQNDEEDKEEYSINVEKDKKEKKEKNKKKEKEKEEKDIEQEGENANLIDYEFST